MCQHITISVYVVRGDTSNRRMIGGPTAVFILILTAERTLGRLARTHLSGNNTMQDAQDRYKYVGVPLSPAIAEELILEKFSGQVTARQTIVEEVNRLHIARGGKSAEAVDLARLVKKALQNLRDRELAENPAQGYWRIGPEANSEANEVEADTSGLEGVRNETAIEPIPAADVVLRTDAHEKGGVYLYYLPAYRLQSEAENATVWPCKIGRNRSRSSWPYPIAGSNCASRETPHCADRLHQAPSCAGSCNPWSSYTTR